MPHAIMFDVMAPTEQLAPAITAETAHLDVLPHTPLRDLFAPAAMGQA